jgi:5S rRNA maturation endonuclease (ribonuclease M5)
LVNEHVGGDKNTIPAFVTDNEINTSSDPNFYDYVRIDDFIKNTGIQPKDFHPFCVKELLDNACDFVEKYYGNGTIDVHIEEKNNLFFLTVRNPNERNIQIFTNLIQTFNYRRAFSSKSNQYKVTRGAQGDAIKKLGTMAYMKYGKNQDWQHPISFQHNGRIEAVYLHVDRKNGRIVPRIEPGLHHGRTVDSTDTVVRMILPPIESREDKIKLLKYFKTYALFNTHISFRLYVEGSLEPHCSLHALQPIATDFKNPNSVYCYDEQELIDFLNDIIPKTMSVYDAISKSGFREINQRDARFDNWKNITLEQITDTQVRKLHRQLRKSMLPMSKLSVPYSVKSVTRKDALIRRYNQIKPVELDIDLERAIYTRTKPDGKFVHIELDNKKNTIKRFPYIFEVLAIPIKPQCGINDNIIISGVNYSTAITNKQYFDGEWSNEYQWEHKRTHEWLSAANIEEIIRMSMVGRNINDIANIPPNKQKVPCVLIAHLVAPRIEYISYGKSSLVLKPFSTSIAEIIQDAILKLPPKTSYTGLSKQKEKEKPNTIECLRELLVIRWNTVKANPLILDPSSNFYDPWSQSTVWYYLREEYLLLLEEKYGIVIIKENTRNDVTAVISGECENLPGSPTREQLGIFASPRATMYFRGRWYDVDIKEIPSLAGKGTHVVFIEKRGAVEQIKHISDIHGVAFVNTQGHFAEYPKDLVPEIIRKGGYVIILTDFDCAGIHIAERVIRELAGIRVNVEINRFGKSSTKSILVTDRVKRLGIDLDTLDYFVSKGIKDKQGKLITSREELLKIVQEPYPKHQEPEKQQPGYNVVSPVIEYARKYVLYRYKNKHYKSYKRYEYIYNNFEYLTGLSIESACIHETLKTEETEGLSKKETQVEIKKAMKDRTTGAAKRIELDSVIKVVKANMFAEFVIDKIEDGNRAIELPKNYFAEKFHILPERIQKFFLYVTDKSNEASNPTEDEIRSNLKQTKGLPSVDIEDALNEKLLADVIAADSDMEIIATKCGELMRPGALPEVKHKDQQPKDNLR